MKDTLVDTYDVTQFARLQGKISAVQGLCDLFTKPMFSPTQEQ